MASNLISNYGEIDQSTEINQLLIDMCMNDKHADVIFIVKNTKIPAHKAILSARSSYFESLFGGGFVEAKQPEVKLEVPLNAFKAILKYIYTGCLSLAAIESDEIVEVYDLANQYGFESLKKTILGYLTENLTLENCINFINAAQLYSLNDLQISCLKFMDINAIELLGHGSFKELELSGLCTLLKRDSFYAPEVDIFNAICNWYTCNPDADIKEALSTVRWSELSSDDLLHVVFESNVLDTNDLLKLTKANPKNTACRITPSTINTEENVATADHGATTISGENSSALLDGNFTDYDWNKGCTFCTMESYIPGPVSGLNEEEKLKSSIIVDLGDIKIINYIKMLLMDKDARSYSYYVDVSLDGETYTRLFDYTQEYRRSWQFLYFESRPIQFIKLVATRAIDIKNKRKDYSTMYTGPYSNPDEEAVNCNEYDSFDVVGLKAMYKTTNIPKQINGVIVPSKNVATVERGASVFRGCGGGNNMLNIKLGDFTCHEIGSFILLQFNQPYVVGSLRMLLGNNLNHSNKYSFCIETSLNKGDWEMAIDKREEALTGWQEFDFVPRPAIFIKITGTQKGINFICAYFECPRNPQKPTFKRSHQ